jgi:hypothetical protein
MSRLKGGLADVGAADESELRQRLVRTRIQIRALRSKMADEMFTRENAQSIIAQIDGKEPIQQKTVG